MLHCEVIYPLGEATFKCETYGLPDLYKAVCSVIKAERLMYPNQEQAFTDFMHVCVRLDEGKITAFEGCVFSIKVIE